MLKLASLYCTRTTLETSSASICFRRCPPTVMFCSPQCSCSRPFRRPRCKSSFLPCLRSTPTSRATTFLAGSGFAPSKQERKSNVQLWVDSTRGPFFWRIVYIPVTGTDVPVPQPAPTRAYGAKYCLSTTAGHWKQRPSAGLDGRPLCATKSTVAWVFEFKLLVIRHWINARLPLDGTLGS